MAVLIMAVCRPVISNYKVSVSLGHNKNIRNKVLELEKNDAEWRKATNRLPHKKQCSFFILRELNDNARKAVFTVFYSGHINITKLKTLKDVELASYYICKRLNVSQSHPRIDNITASGKLNLRGSVNKLKQICDYLAKRRNKCDIKSVSFDTQKFPGGFIRPASLVGTTLLFNTGKYVLVGSRSVENVTHLHDWLEWAIWKATQAMTARRKG
jgi:TATA-box binding protein (TBP) (component of TFIID and TFIIIB)